MKFIIPLTTLLFLTSCAPKERASLGELLKDTPAIEGKADYLTSPFVTPGDRVYMVGHQDGTFPDLGWHIKGEMGGIWLHPIKLMDGFEAAIETEEKAYNLADAATFFNYPVGSRHVFLPAQGLKIERWQFVPDEKEGMVIQFIVKNESDKRLDGTFKFNGRVDLRPTWLAERQDIVDGKDEIAYNASNDSFEASDTNNSWNAVYGSDRPSSNRGLRNFSTDGNGVSGFLEYELSVAAGAEEQINFFIAGSYTSMAKANETFFDLKKHYLSYLKAKQNKYNKLADQTKLTIPDPQLQQTFEWLKYNCDWLIQTVPEIGTGITAGIPDYPWWFGVDSEYALKGYMAIGQTTAVYETIALLDSISNAVNGNGKIVHEVSSNGVVFNPGNINETPQYASLIWEIYQWNGDINFLRTYFPTIQKGLDWLMEANDSNNNLFPDGFGMMEIHGLNSEMIDVAAYTQKAFEDASKMAMQLNEKELAADYHATAETIKRKINDDFWSEDFSSYADFIGTDEQTLHLIEDAIVRADTLKKPWAVEELVATKAAILANPSPEPRPFVLHHNWVVNTPMEMGIADKEKAIKALNTAKKFTNPFGVFVTGIDRDASAGADDGSFQGSKAFSYTGAVMTLPTGVQAVAENNYGRPNDALDYLKKMSRSFSFALPGSMYEVSPDYGMMAQAWNIYSFAFPIVRQFFGLQPKAYEKAIIITPQMPDEWDDASLENIKVADNVLSIYWKKQGGKLTVEVEQTARWKLVLDLSNCVAEDAQIISSSAATTEGVHSFESDANLAVTVSY